MGRILVVDDDEAVRGFLEASLKIEGHDVTTACDGNRALAALQTGTFDLVITDIIMPDREGIETIIEIRRTRPDLKIIAMSGGGRGNAVDYLLVASELGASSTLVKPFSMQELFAAVSDVLK